MSVTAQGSTFMERKIINISSKRQITIPLSMFTQLGFSDEAECMVRNNELVIRPARRDAGGEFAEQILADLINQGLSGTDLLTAFKEKQAAVRPAVEKMIAQAEAAARGEGEYFTLDEVFPEENDT